MPQSVNEVILAGMSGGRSILLLLDMAWHGMAWRT